MKIKKIIMMSIFLILLLLSTNVVNAEDGVNCGIAGEWTELTSSVDDITIEKSTNYYLTQDVSIKSMTIYENAQSVNICLNGHTLELTTDGRGINMKSGTVSLNILGSNGKLIVPNGDGISALSESTVNIEDAKIITDGVAIHSGYDQSDITINLNSVDFIRTGATVTVGILNIGGANITMTDVSFALENDYSVHSAIYAKNSNLTIKDSEIKNITTSGSGAYGSITLDNSTLNITNSVISNNFGASAGAIYLTAQSSATISNTKIINNTGKNAGGIFIYKSDVTLNDNVDISYNTASGSYSGNVGGIYLESGNLVINDATISYNTGHSSGGIYVEATHSPVSQSIAKIYGAQITHNTATKESDWAGGGIYVNGKTGAEDGVLYLYNVVVTNNTAKTGGGLAGCPTSTVKLYLTNGGAIYNNSASSKAEDLYLNYLDVNADVYISPFMLGGGLNNWLYGKGSSLEGTAINLSDLVNYDDLGNLIAKNGASSDAQAKASSKAKVIISDNISNTYGGGIGTNGTVIIGTEDLIDIQVSKIWDDVDASSRPTEIKVYLLLGGEVIDSVILNEENNWSYTWENYEYNDSLEYTIVEEEYDDYITSYSDPVYEKEKLELESTSTETDSDTSDTTKETNNGDATTDNKVVKITLSVTNTAATILDINKIWIDNNDVLGVRPSSITVDIYGNDAFIETVVLSAENNWTITKKYAKYDADGNEIIYTVIEREIDGYETSYDGYTIINTIEESEINPPATDINTNSYIDLKDFLSMMSITGLSIMVIKKRGKYIKIDSLSSSIGE